MTDRALAEAATLYAQWKQSVQYIRDTTNEAALDKADAYEQECHHRLSVHLTAHDLWGTEYDPRGD